MRLTLCDHTEINCRPRPRCLRDGLILVIVLVVIVVLALAAFTFAELMLSEQQAARIEGRKAQARALTESAVEMLKLYLAQTPDVLTQAGGTYDNAAQFQSVQVLDDGTKPGSGRFCIIAPKIENGQITGTRFGLENESGKLNINAVAAIEKKVPGAGKALLMALPGMDDATSDAILDWLDADDNPRPNGAESDYYGGLTPPYGAKNGPLDTIEELLLVKGVTPQMLFGSDANRNGMIDASEQNLPQIADQNSADPEMNRGWAAYLTLYGKEANVKPDGTARINLNSDDLQKLHDDLSQVLTSEQAAFIVAYRLYGGTQASQSSGSNSNSPSSQAAPAPSVFRLVYFQATPAPPAGGGAPGTPPGQGGANGGGQRGPSGGQRGAGAGQRGSGGRQSTSNNGSAVAADSVTLDLTQKPKVQISSILDLVGMQIRYTKNQQSSQSSGQGNGQPSSGETPGQPASGQSTGQPSTGQPSSGQQSSQQQQTVTLKAAFPDDASSAASYLPKLLDNTTTNSAKTIPGRININLAPRALLQAIPGMTADTVDQIMANRQPEQSNDTAPDQQYETWPYTKGIVKLNQMKQMMPYITTGGSVYKAQIVGYFDADGPAARAEAIIDASDTTSGAARIVFWRDITHLGRGFSLDTLQNGGQ